MGNKTLPLRMRSGQGASLIELLIATVVMTVASTAVFGLVLSTMSAGSRVNNKCDTIDMASAALEKITRDVRMGRSLGDVFGTVVNGMVQGSSTFPSNRNPLYGAGQAPPAGWPVWADSSAPVTYTVDNRTLIVQVPIFDPAGFPTAIPAGAGNPPAPQVQDNVETHIYRVLPDPELAGEWILQCARIPGIAAPGYNPATEQRSPQIICKGIIGPMQNGQPCIFQYLDKSDNSRTPQNTIRDGGSEIAAFTGVIINLELTQHNQTSRVNGQWKTPGVLALKSEVFLRNNSLATTIGMPSITAP